MAKSKFIGLRISEVELSQIKSVRLTSETVSQTVRRLLSKAIKDEREDLKSWQDLIVRLSNLNNSEILDRLNTIEMILEEIRTRKPPNQQTTIKTTNDITPTKKT